MRSLRLRKEWIPTIKPAPCLLAFYLLMCAFGGAAPSAQAQHKPQLLILTDIGGDPDDQQSIRRLMLYTNEFDVVGFVASASGIPQDNEGAVTRPELIEEVIDDYEQVRGQLTLHADGYPNPDTLRARIWSGNPHRGVQNVGDGHSTVGSNHIISAVDAANAGPVHIAVWGGATDLAQALYDVRASRSNEATNRFVDKLRVYAIADQDAWGDHPGTGAWIQKHFPDVRYLETGPSNINKYTALFRGMYQNDAAGGDLGPIPLVHEEVMPLIQKAWVTANVRTGHGPLGADYPLTNQNPSTKHNTEGIKEGDTPSWFYALPNGLSDPAHPTYGGWGGRFKHEQNGYYTDAADEHWSDVKDAAIGRRWTVARWRKAYQHDFAARMDWCVQAYNKANHSPTAVVGSNETRKFVERRAEPGEEITLNAKASTDPDGDGLSYSWWVYSEPSGYSGAVQVEQQEAPAATVHVPSDAAGKTLHVILEVTDDGKPSLTSYRRILLHITEAAR